MLKIRPEHLSALAEQQAAGFVERMRLHLRDVFAIEVSGLDDLKLNELIKKICAQGEQWGITKEPIVERLIELFVGFEQLRRHPLPKWIDEIVRDPGRSGVRALLKLENGLLFQEGRVMPVESSGPVAGAPFYQRVDAAFWSEIRKENGARLRSRLVDSNGEAHRLTISPGDGACQRQWKAIAAEKRKSRAIPKSVTSASTPWVSRSSSATYPPALLTSKGGEITKVAITACR